MIIIRITYQQFPVFMLALIQTKLETISLLAENKCALIDIVDNLMNGHPLIETLHVPMLDQKVSYLVGVIPGEDVLELHSSITALRFQSLTIPKVSLPIGLRLVSFVDYTTV